MPQNNGQDAMRNALDQLIDGATSVKKDSGKSLGKGILNSIYSGMELGRQTKNGRWFLQVDWSNLKYKNIFYQKRIVVFLHILENSQKAN